MLNRPPNKDQFVKLGHLNVICNGIISSLMTADMYAVLVLSTISIKIAFLIGAESSITVRS